MLVEFGEIVAQAYLQAVFDVFQRSIDSDIEVLSRGSRSMFEPSSGKPRWEVFHYESCSAGETKLLY